MPPTQPGPSTVGSSSFDPDALLSDSSKLQKAKDHLAHNDLRNAIISYFDLPHADNYVYHAVAGVTLEQVQAAVNAGRVNGLHGWYEDEENGSLLPNPSPIDIESYTAVFLPQKSSANILKSLSSNAKKGSLRASIASHLISKRHLDSTVFSVPKSKNALPNPYFDFWIWSCQSLEWGGPNAETAHVKTAHHVLPVFMHHFGCVVPSYEGLEIIRQISNPSAVPVVGGKKAKPQQEDKRDVCDIGSGNGYWTYMLRKLGLTVHAVDNASSAYRTMWIGDTIIADGVQWLRQTRKGAKDDILLLVYPVVGADNFTAKVLSAYKGDNIVVVGTQNGNGYTGFKDCLIDEWIEREKDGFVKVCQIPLPSFAGKDEALFVFRRTKAVGGYM